MKHILSSLQWAIFILAGSIVAPVAIGQAFNLPLVEIAGFLQRTLFIIGISSLLQVYFGHRLPIGEGPAGLWWGLFLIFSSFGAALGMNNYETLQSLEMGLLISGGLFIFLGAFRLIDRIKKIFTPLVTGIYLFLVISQLSSSFIKGIMGIGYMSSELDVKVALASLFVLGITVVLGKSSNPMIRSFAILYGIIVGWILFACLGLLKPLLPAESWFSLPKLFIWGRPRFEASTVITCIITGLLLIPNLLASIEVVKRTTDDGVYTDCNHSSLVMGINQILSGLFSTMGFVPLSISAGFITTTGIKQKMPFIIGNIIIVILGLFPPLTLFFATLPTPVGYAALFLTFSSMIIMAMREFATMMQDARRLQILAASLMIGIGSMFVPAEALKHVPNVIASILNNGLILGVLTAIVLEQSMLIKDKLLSYKTN